MRRYILALLPALAAGPLAAQTVTIKSGEHADFTRLVFYFAEQPDYDLVPAQGGYELRTGQEHEFLTDGVFDLIPRDRIAALEPRPGALGLELNCDCPAEIVDLRPGIVVLDVRDGPALTRRDEDRPRAQRPPVPRQTATPETRVAELDAAAPTAAFAYATGPAPLLPDLGTPFDEATAPPARMAARAAPRRDGAEVAARPTPRADGTEAAARNVGNAAAQVGRAAAQGLLDADLSKVEAAMARAATAPARSDEPAAADPEPAAPGAPDRDAHVSIRTSVDRDLALTIRQASHTADGEPCLPDSSLDVVAWSGGDTSGSRLSRYRTEVIGETGKADPEAVTALARYLVSLSFGAEARAILSAYPGVAEEAELLRALADIVDDGQAHSSGPLMRQAGCPGSAALWATLASPKLSPGEIDTAAVAAAFSALPLHLRRHLGPKLAERFLEAGETATAETIRNAIARASGQHGPGFELLEARIDLEAGRAEAAGKRLDALTGEARAPEALALSLEQKLAAGESPDAAFLQNVAATAYEMKGTPLAARLKAGEIRARTSSGGHLAALDELERAAGSGMIGADAVQPLRTGVYADAAENADDGTFLRLAFRATAELGTGPEDLEARRALARRLLTHQLSDQARSLVNSPEIVPTNEDRLILAEASILDGRPEIARGYVMGLSDPRADALRERLRAQAGRETQARAVPAASAEPDRELAESESEGMLARSREFLDAARSARERLEALLAAADAGPG